MRLIVGMTGATGAPLGVELLQALRAIPDVETHLVMSKWAKTTIELETPYTPAEVAALADYCHSRPIRRRPFPPAHFVPTA
ncbi:decarboxylase [Salmonella enterica subsp. enterica]|nr:decarboxylase [Salmonella enterica subsp. enterica]